MPRYSIYLTCEASQVIDVEADTLDEAIDEAMEQHSLYEKATDDFDMGDVEPLPEFCRIDGEPVGAQADAEGEDDFDLGYRLAAIRDALRQISDSAELQSLDSANKIDRLKSLRDALRQTSGSAEWQARNADNEIDKLLGGGKSG